MSLNGIIDKLKSNIINGWVSSDSTFEPLVIYVKDKKSSHIYKHVEANIDRPDLNKLGINAKGFSIDLNSINAKIGDLLFECVCGDERINVSFWRPLALSNECNKLSASELKVLSDHLDYDAYLNLRNLFVAGTSQTLTKLSKSKLAVISYANGTGGWFDYFLKHYSRLVGPESIYIITPKPSEFQSYKLGGVISCPNMEFDDVARACFMSSFATGLQSYFDWTLVCDVDEIIIPNPLSGKSFYQTLESANQDVLITRGLDVIQMPDEPDFDLSDNIIAQRKYAIANTALSKPHLARVPILYSAGFHYSNYRSQFPDVDDGFITLHLKWACKKIREQVHQIVTQTNYSDANIEQYCKKSVSDAELHPSYLKAINSNAINLYSEELRELEGFYYKKLSFSNLRGLWLGEHKAGEKFIDLSSLEE